MSQIPSRLVDDMTAVERKRPQSTRLTETSLDSVGEANSSNEKPLIVTNDPLQRYYASLESRLGYRVFLGGTRHMGYYDHDTYWPFPISKALRAMENRLFQSLGLSAGQQVLDAGCGFGHVAIHLARKGLRIQGVDVVDRHVAKAQENIKKQGLDQMISIHKMNYQHLGFANSSFDGLFTMETFVHSTGPEGALREFFRVLRPGGKIALYEYDHTHASGRLRSDDRLASALNQINHLAAMPANARFKEGVLQCMLEDAGFQDVKVHDLSINIKPMARLFFVIAYIPYLLFVFFGLQAWFVNTMAGVEGYRALRKGFWRYTAVTARKPPN